MPPQVLIDDLVASVDREREDLKLAREQLELEMKQFELEKERVNQVLQDNEQVTSRCRINWHWGRGIRA